MKKHLSKNNIQALTKVERLNLINSVTGYKSANLIGSIDKNGNHNLAVFSSITHLGSNPALVSFTLRPTTVPRHTYVNLLDTSFFTINHISESMIAQAHQTSAKYEYSEFKEVGLTPEIKNDFIAPYVKESPIQLGCKYVNSYPIKENDCILIIANIEEIHITEKALLEDYWVQLDKAKIVTVNGIDGYALPKLLDRFEYAKPDKKTTSKLK